MTELKKIFEKILEKKILLSDGSMGTLLRQRGLGAGKCQEEWNASHPEKIKGIHREYLQAGCNLILTNTLGGNKLSLAKFGLGEKIKEFNQAGARLAQEAVREAKYQNTYVLGDLGSTGKLLQPLGEITSGEMEDAFREQAFVLAEAGVDGFIVETMSDIQETEIAVRAARETNLLVLASLSFDPGKRGFRTMMGVDISTAVERLTSAGAGAIGTNCGTVNLEEMTEIILTMRSLTGIPLIAQPNAGKPSLINNQTIYNQSPEEMARGIEKLIKAGANIIGGCCGTTPEHLKEIARAVKCTPK